MRPRDGVVRARHALEKYGAEVFRDYYLRRIISLKLILHQVRSHRNGASSRAHYESIFKKLDPGGINFEYRLTPEPAFNDEILKQVKPHSLIINATGLGKDRPGSPLTDACEFPYGSIVWEINYRGELRFMHQALEQKEAKNLTVEDGWIYFVHGWTQVIAEVFHKDINGKVFRELDNVARKFRAR